MTTATAHFLTGLRRRSGLRERRACRSRSPPENELHDDDSFSLDRVVDGRHPGRGSRRGTRDGAECRPELASARHQLDRAVRLGDCAGARRSAPLPPTSVADSTRSRQRRAGHLLSPVARGTAACSRRGRHLHHRSRQRLRRRRRRRLLRARQRQRRCWGGPGDDVCVIEGRPGRVPRRLRRRPPLWRLPLGPALRGAGRASATADPGAGSRTPARQGQRCGSRGG